MEGDRVLTAMAYTLLKMHRKTLLKLGMDDILQFLQVLSSNKCESGY
jgi:USP6 N-terminal-like protein